jgi:uncharacterized DUF497 family protein
MKFEWDDAKATANRRKHRVSFEEAMTVFEPADPEIFEDDAHSEIELRFTAIGFSEKARLLTVSFARRGDAIRIISARRSTKSEAELYAQAKNQKG